MADLTEEEDKELKRTGERHADGVGIRRDFSVIHSKQLKKNHLFLGPARFVNVSLFLFLGHLRVEALRARRTDVRCPARL